MITKHLGYPELPLLKGRVNIALPFLFISFRNPQLSNNLAIADK